MNAPALPPERATPAVGGPPPLPSRAPRAPEVLIYGWPAQAAELLKKTLADGGIAARILEGSDLNPSTSDVVVSPLPSIEAFCAARKAPLRAHVIVAVKSPESDLHRAQKVGAKGYLGTPVDNDLLLRAVRRCLKQNATG